MYRNWIYYIKKTHKTFVSQKKIEHIICIQNYVYKTRGKFLIIMRLDGKIMMNNLLQTYKREEAAAAKQEYSSIIHIFIVINVHLIKLKICSVLRVCSVHIL